MDYVSEADRAAFYEANKDNPEVWGEIEHISEPSPDRALSLTVTLRLVPPEATRLHQLAQAQNASYSEVLRAALRAYQPPS